MQRPAPLLTERRRELRAPLLADEVVPTGVHARRGQVEHLDERVRIVVERLDERLDDRGRAVVGPPVAPLLQVVSAGQVPAGRLGRFVAEAAQVHRVAHVRQRLLKVQLGRGVVDGIHAQHEEGVHLARLHRRGQVGQGLVLGLNLVVSGVEKRNGGAEAAESLVDRHGEGVHFGRLGLARHHHAVLARLAQVPGHFPDVRPLSLAPRDVRCLPHAQLGREGRRKSRNAPGPHPEPMVRTAPRGGVAALHRVEPAHGVLYAVQAPPLRKPLRVVPEVGGTPVEEVGVEAHDHLRLPELEARPEGATEGLLRAEPPRIGSGGGVRHPLQVRKAIRHALPHRLRGRGGGLCHQDRHPALVRLVAELATKRHEVAPRGRASLLPNGPGPVGVVQVEHRGLFVGAGAALPRRMVVVALDLGRAPLIALGDDRPEHTPERHARGVVVRNAGRHRVRLPGVRQNLLFRPPAASQPRHGHGRSHQLQELPARRPTRGLAVSRHKLRQVVAVLVGLRLGPVAPKGGPRRRILSSRLSVAGGRLRIYDV